MLPEIQNKKIAYACLNWGMGHLTRSISILKELSHQNQVYFFGNESQISFLKAEIPTLSFHLFSDYRLKFSGKSFLVEMIFQSPRMVQDIQNEKKQLETLHLKHKFDLVISDNRFGFRIENVHSIILTHQLKIKSPLFEKQGSALNQIYLNKFDEIWVPDDAESSLSGELSRVKLATETKYIGNTSDLKYEEKVKIYDYFIIGSGPEPYRQNFILKLLEHFKNTEKSVLVTGMNELPNISNLHIQLVKIMNRADLNEAILQSNIVISRAGYTSIMDLLKTKTQAILIPTSKQYEQEYLAKHLQENKQFRFLTETEIPTIN